MTEIQVVHDPSRRRDQASVDGEAAGFAEYILTDELIVFTHTEVDRRFDGRGVGSASPGSRWTTSARRARAGSCRSGPFIKGWIGRHREYVPMVYGIPASTARD